MLVYLETVIPNIIFPNVSHVIHKFVYSKAKSQTSFFKSKEPNEFFSKVKSQTSFFKTKESNVIQKQIEIIEWTE